MQPHYIPDEYLCYLSQPLHNNHDRIVLSNHPRKTYNEVHGMTSHFHSGIRIGWSNPPGCLHYDFSFWQSKHLATNYPSSFFKISEYHNFFIIVNVFWYHGWPEYELAWNSLKITLLSSVLFDTYILSLNLTKPCVVRQQSISWSLVPYCNLCISSLYMSSCWPPSKIWSYKFVP